MAVAQMRINNNSTVSIPAFVREELEMELGSYVHIQSVDKKEGTITLKKGKMFQDQ